MRIVSSFSMAVVALFALTSVTQASDVLVFTDANFESQIGAYDVALVEFYAPWCGHCKNLAPHYEVAATALKVNDPPVALIKVDCTVETKVCGKYGVSGYPTLKIFKDGEMSADYQGPRESAGIIKFMKSKAGPVAKQLTSVADYEKFLANTEHSVIAFVKEEGSTLETEFKKVADALNENVRFAYSSDAAVLAKAGHSDKFVIYQPPRLHTPLEPKENVFSGAEMTSDALKTFVKTELQGLAGHRTPANAAEFFGKPLIVVLFQLDYTKDPKGSNYVRNRVIKVAKKVKDVHFAVSSFEDFGQELEEFGFKLEANKRFMIARGINNEKYKFDGEYSVANLEKFALDLAAGSLESYMKSEPIPEANDEAVVTVVGRNFDEIINDKTKDVLIEFYAPWCGHCKSLAPKYEELAQKLKGETSLVIAKIDATANDIPPSFGVQGFPTLFFVPAGAKDAPKKYEGGREVEDFVKYLAKEATQELNGFDRSGNPQDKSEL